MSSELQFRVLRHLKFNPHLIQRELSKSLGDSLGGVNYFQGAFVAKGSVKIQNFRNNKNKWIYAYLSTPQGIAKKTDLTGSLLRSKVRECQQLKEVIEALKIETIRDKLDGAFR